MVQPDFVKALLAKLKEHKIHTAIETTGYIKKEIFRELAPMFDLLLFDVKHYDSDKHYEGTHVHNELIIENLAWAISQGIEVLPRIPVIPDFNDSLDDAKGIAALLNQVGAKKVQLLPFHQFGENKYHLLGKTYSYENVKALHPEDLTDYQRIFLDVGINCFSNLLKIPYTQKALAEQFLAKAFLIVSFMNIISSSLSRKTAVNPTQVNCHSSIL